MLLRILALLVGLALLNSIGAGGVVAAGPRTAFDYDGDGKADVAVYRAATGSWYIKPSGGGTNITVQFGAITDTPVEGDFDGDGKSDIAVWRRSNGVFYVRQSTTGAVRTQQWGQLGDNARLSADYDGDGITDFTVWRPGAQGNYHVLQSSNGIGVQVAWGTSPSDRPVVSDANGDHVSDFVVLRVGEGMNTAVNAWVRLVAGGVFTTQAPTPNLAVTAAYDWTGDTTDDVRSLPHLGRGEGELAVPADYDGDGKGDMAAYVGGVWHIEFSGGGSQVVEWGLPDDYPLPRVFVTTLAF